MEIEKRKTRHITSFQIIIAGFFLVILVGSLLLMFSAFTCGPFGRQRSRNKSFYTRRQAL